MDSTKDNLFRQTAVCIEPMMVEEIPITYRFVQSPFGWLLMASAEKGICLITLAMEEEAAVKRVRSLFPKAHVEADKSPVEVSIDYLFDPGLLSSGKTLHLHLKGTPFQLQVWQALLEIPFAKTVSYGDIAKRIGHPNACRAVGTAVGANPLFFLIPCHRVIRFDGSIGKYYWGTALKIVLQEWEKNSL